MRRSERISRSALCTEKSVPTSINRAPSPINNKLSLSSYRVAKKKVSKSRSKRISKLSDQESTESEIPDDVFNDCDWKPDTDSQYFSELESVGSLDDFQSVPLDETKTRKSKQASVHSSVRPSSTATKKREKKSHRSTQKSRNNDILMEAGLSDSDEPSEWEDVHNKTIGEADYLKDLLDSVGGSEPRNSIKNSEVPLSLEVPLLSNSRKVTKKDPKVLEQMAVKRRLKELCYSMHLTNLLCFLAYTRRLNKMCDSPLYRALGLSLLGRCKALFSRETDFIEKHKWTKEHLQACIVSILTKQDPAAISKSNSEEKVKSTLVVRLRENKINEVDCIVLFVSALRALAFDVRVVIGINPCPIRPNSSYNIPNNVGTTKVNGTRDLKLKKGKGNRQIISSSETEEASDLEKLRSNNKSKAKTFKKLGISTFAEVFLPSSNQWIVVDPSPPNGYVGKLGSDHSWLYCVGISSAFPVDYDSLPYVGRNPVDLSARYDPNWCIRSRLDRLPAEKWSRLLNLQKCFFDRDALTNKTIVDPSTNPVTYQRDLHDERAIQENLLSEPIPECLSDFKNHPLYVLSRHLLKYQVIYPSDAIPLGFFKNEPVYSRDCVKLCHNRESWLKEAMVVRPHEKPVKIVKARPSLKRRLLQGFDEKPQTVELFGPWQVEPYEPPIAKDGIVPRSPHGTVELFKPCMLPVGCAHICLTGIHHIAKKLGIDCAPAVVGWTFHGAGWAHPKQEGYVVCKESIPALVDAWRHLRMNAAKAAAEDRTERALENWRHLVRGLFLWNRIKAQFALAPLNSNPSDEIKPTGNPKKSAKTRVKMGKSKEVANTNGSIVPEKLHAAVPTVDSCLDATSLGGWQRLSQLNEACVATIPIPILESVKKRPRRASKRSIKTKRRKNRVSSSSETSEEDPSLNEDSSSDFI